MALHCLFFLLIQEVCLSLYTALVFGDRPIGTIIVGVFYWLLLIFFDTLSYYVLLENLLFFSRPSLFINCFKKIVYPFMLVLPIPQQGLIFLLMLIAAVI